MGPYLVINGENCQHFLKLGFSFEIINKKHKKKKWFFVALTLAKNSQFCFGNCENEFLPIRNENFAFPKLKPIKILSVASSFIGFNKGNFRKYAKFEFLKLAKTSFQSCQNID